METDMTYRDRRLAKAERLTEWAAKREDKAAELHARNEPFRGDHAFNTQPGHIPERARVIARTERAWEHQNKAREMSSRAAGILAAADRAIYSDDPDAIEALEARIGELEAKRDRMKTRNAAFRKEHRAELKTMTPYQRNQAMPFQSFELTNLSGNIKRNRDRLAQLRGLIKCQTYGCGATFFHVAEREHPYLCLGCADNL